MNLAKISTFISDALFLTMVAGIPLYGAYKKVNVYEEFVEGAKHSFEVMLKILPHLVAMLVAVDMFRIAGGFEFLAMLLSPFLHWIGMPSELLPLAVVRPFSGGASNAMLANIAMTHGGDSLITKMGATLMGSTETTFYVIAIYFGSVGIRRSRHAVPAGLIADFVGIIASVWICRLVFA